MGIQRFLLRLQVGQLLKQLLFVASGAALLRGQLGLLQGDDFFGVLQLVPGNLRLCLFAAEHFFLFGQPGFQGGFLQIQRRQLGF